MTVYLFSVEKYLYTLHGDERERSDVIERACSIQLYHCVFLFHRNLAVWRSIAGRRDCDNRNYENGGRVL